MNPAMKTDQTEKVYDLRKFNSINVVDLIKSIISFENFDTNNAFYVADLDQIYNRVQLWKETFPRVMPYYAMKNNNDCRVIKLLRYLGLGFECSSLSEIEQLIKLEIPCNTMLFGHPSKSGSHIKYCEYAGVKKIVFDNLEELKKIKNNHPRAECLLRIKCMSLPSKFGADQQASVELIKQAIEWEMNLIGISFYVGFRQKSAININQAIKDSRFLFDYARENFGYLMSCLDIGGGFPGSWQSVDLFKSIGKDVNEALDLNFPFDYFNELNKNTTKFELIAEPGTYFTCAAYTLCVAITAKKTISGINTVLPNNPDNNGNNTLAIIDNKCIHINLDHSSQINDSKSLIYYINDSVYGSFKWYSLQDSIPIFHLAAKRRNNHLVRSCVGGGTCDSGDFICKNYLIPEMEIGDFIIFKNMGSYTKACAINFCGIELPATIYVSTELWDKIKLAFNNQQSATAKLKTFKDFIARSSAKTILHSLICE